jgi:hypothetical protein
MNNTCRDVSSAIRKTQQRKGEYEVGETLLCKDYLVHDKIKFNKNYEISYYISR